MIIEKTFKLVIYYRTRNLEVSIFHCWNNFSHSFVPTFDRNYMYRNYHLFTDISPGNRYALINIGTQANPSLWQSRVKKAVWKPVFFVVNKNTSNESFFIWFGELLFVHKNVWKCLKTRLDSLQNISWSIRKIIKTKWIKIYAIFKNSVNRIYENYMYSCPGKIDTFWVPPKIGKCVNLSGNFFVSIFPENFFFVKNHCFKISRT